MKKTPQEVIEAAAEDVENEDIGSEAVSEEDSTAEGELDTTGDTPTESVEAEAEAGDKTKSEELDDKKSRKAPVGWDAKQREDWSRVPPHLQDKILSREKRA